MEELHLRENTLVIFTGDNGMCVGQHGVIGKGNGTFPMNMYEESVLVPMIARLPGVIPAGRVENGLYGHMDIFPTVAEFTGVPVPEGLCGQSLKKALLGQAAEDDGAVFLCDEYGPTRMVRTRDWKYIHRYPYGPHELYDLANDPHERVNLGGQAGMRAGGGGLAAAAHGILCEIFRSRAGRFPGSGVWQGANAKGRRASGRKALVPAPKNGGTRMKMIDRRGGMAVI